MVSVEDLHLLAALPMNRGRLFVFGLCLFDQPARHFRAAGVHWHLYGHFDSTRMRWMPQFVRLLPGDFKRWPSYGHASQKPTTSQL